MTLSTWMQRALAALSRLVSLLTLPFFFLRLKPSMLGESLEPNWLDESLLLLSCWPGESLSQLSLLGESGAPSWLNESWAWSGESWAPLPGLSGVMEDWWLDTRILTSGLGERAIPPLEASFCFVLGGLPAEMAISMSSERPLLFRLSGFTATWPSGMISWD